MDLIFLLAGIVLLIKKQVSVSKTRVLKGNIVKFLGILYILPTCSNLLNRFLGTPDIALSLIVISVVVTLGVVIFYRPKPEIVS